MLFVNKMGTDQPAHSCKRRSNDFHIGATFPRAESAKKHTKSISPQKYCSDMLHHRKILVRQMLHLQLGPCVQSDQHLCYSLPRKIIPIVAIPKCPRLLPASVADHCAAGLNLTWPHNSKWAIAWQNQQNDLCTQQTQIRLGRSSQWIAKDSSFLHADSEEWSDWVDSQADVSHRWAHRSFYRFCHALLKCVFFYDVPDVN